jgi:hypothetical protein
VQNTWLNRFIRVDQQNHQGIIFVAQRPLKLPERKLTRAARDDTEPPAGSDDLFQE